MKLLVVVDMQNDFIDGALGTKEAVGILDAVAQKIHAYRAAGDMVIFTRDTHEENYMDTQEGHKLPVPHCIRVTEGWQISSKLDVADSRIVDKPTFGSTALAHLVSGMQNLDGIEVIGVCTDICVISNVMILKAALPEVPIQVDASCCAGVTPASHKNALEAMKMCQVEVIGE